MRTPHLDLAGRARTGGIRWLRSLPAILQIAVAATASYSFAHFVVGHAVPFLAATVTVSSIGFAGDARLRRVIETALGMTVGIVLADVVVLVAGKGWWQIAVVLLVSLSVARLVSPSAGFATVAGIQSLMVVVLADPDGGPFTRSLDGLIGGTVAFLVVALSPRDARRIVERQARAVLAALAAQLQREGAAIGTADAAIATDVLARMRETQPLVDRWTERLDAAIAVARTSPYSRRRLPELLAQRTVLHGADRAVRNLRVVARRVETLVADGRSRPALASVVTELGEAVLVLERALDDPAQLVAARQRLALVALRLDPATLVPGAGVADVGLVLLVRPLAVDLLVATGLGDVEARACLPALDAR